MKMDGNYLIGKIKKGQEKHSAGIVLTLLWKQFEKLKSKCQ